MKIKQETVDGVIDHAEREAPLEACGYLAEKDGIITALFPLVNIDRSEEHFAFDPGEQFAALKKARGEGLRIGAVYHSHPKSPARPSAEDIRLAYDRDILYAIVSLAGPRPELKLYRISGQNVESVPLEVVP